MAKLSIRWTIVNHQPPESLTLDGDGKGDIGESLKTFKTVFA